jgi:hypothetical protein
MRNTSIRLSGAALALAGAVATPSMAHTHHRHMASGMHQASTPAERQQTAQLNQQQLAQAQNPSGNGNMAEGATGEGAGNMAVNNPGGDSTATGTSVGSNATGTATQQNGLTTEPTSYQRTRSSAGAGTSGTAGGSTENSGTTGTQGVGEDRQLGSPMNGSMQGNPSGAVSPPPVANPSGTPQK